MTDNDSMMPISGCSQTMATRLAQVIFDHYAHTLYTSEWLITPSFKTFLMAHIERTAAHLAGYYLIVRDILINNKEEDRENIAGIVCSMRDILATMMGSNGWVERRDKETLLITDLLEQQVELCRQVRTEYLSASTE